MIYPSPNFRFEEEGTVRRVLSKPTMKWGEGVKNNLKRVVWNIFVRDCL